MGNYGITFLDDDDLAEGHSFVLVDLPGGAWVFYRESDLSPTALEDSWSAYRELRSAAAPDPEALAARLRTVV